MKKMDKVEVMVKERKAVLLEDRAESEARPVNKPSKFARKIKSAQTHSSQKKFDGKKKFSKARGIDTPLPQMSAKKRSFKKKA